MDGFRENCSLNLKVTVAVTNTLKKKEKKNTAQLDYFINHTSIQKSIRRNRIIEELCNYTLSSIMRLLNCSLRNKTISIYFCFIVIEQ